MLCFWYIITSFMCFFDIDDRGGSKGWVVFYHFVGAVPGSTELEQLLKRLLLEMGQVKVSI